MSRSERDKGRKAEREVANLLAALGWTVRGLEGSGDWLAIKDGRTLHVEVKRQEVLRLPLWTRQALAEAPAGTTPVVAFRQSRQPWWVVVPRPAGKLPPISAVEVKIAGRVWLRLHLTLFAAIVGSQWLPPLPTAPLAPTAAERSGSRSASRSRSRSGGSSSEPAG